jgi:uncharacterized protein Usg
MFSLSGLNLQKDQMMSLSRNNSLQGFGFTSAKSNLPIPDLNHFLKKTK